MAIRELQLSYVSNLRALNGTERRAEEKAFFGDIKERLAALDAGSADHCENLALKEIAFETNLNVQNPLICFPIWSEKRGNPVVAHLVVLTRIIF